MIDKKQLSYLDSIAINVKHFYALLIDSFMLSTSCCGGAAYSLTNDRLKQIIAVNHLPIGRGEAEIIFNLLHTDRQLQRVNVFEMARDKERWLLIPLDVASKNVTFLLLYFKNENQENRDEIDIFTGELNRLLKELNNIIQYQSIKGAS